jgi:dihydrofolate reductase
MGRIIIAPNISLDGVMQDPTGEEGFRFGGWFREIADNDREAWAQVEVDEALASEALLMGRGSYEWFASRWASRTGTWADRLSSMPKYVVSASLEDPKWNNTKVLKGEAVREVSTLKQGVSGDIVVYASGRLAHTLIEHDLVDELRLMIYPFVLGGGQRLFGETTAKKSMRLVGIRRIGDSLALLTYESVLSHGSAIVEVAR